MSESDDTLESMRCLLMANPRPENGCDWCGKALPKRRRRWCSNACERRWYTQHHWGYASKAARKRDARSCKICGITSAQLREQWQAALPEKPSAGKYSKAAREYRKGCRRLAFLYRLEVNHIVPRAGRGYHPGCHNHLDNLETLCHVCHVDITREQGRRRRAERT